jgi:hypothetical protein
MTPLKKLLTGSTSLSIWAVAPHMPQVVGAAILGAVGISAGAVVTYAVGYVATTLVTSWAVKALSPKPASMSPADSMSSQGTLVNARSAAAPHDYVYGTVRKGGTITYLESTGESNNFLHIILTLAGHEVNAIGDIYIDDQIATLDGSGFVTSQSWASKIRIVKYTGSQTTAPALLLAESAQIDSTFVGNGLAYLYIRLEYNQDVFPNGVPLFTAVVQGKKVYDPRTTTTGFSANAALCIRDYITDSRGLGDAAVNNTTFSASANVCDENITLAAGGTEKRYTMNGVINAEQTPNDILQQMMTCCAGTTFWGQGDWQLKVGYYTPPVKTFTLDDLRGPISLQTRQSMGSIFNSVVGTFNDAAQSYITVDYPKLTSAPFLAEDNGVDSPIDLALPFTTSSSSAQRISKLTLYRGREQMTLSAEFGMAGFEVQVGDIVAFTNSRYGWTAKEFEVIGWRFYANQDAGDLRVNLELRETSEAAFDWTAEESAIIGNNTTLPSAYYVPTLGLSVSDALVVYHEKLTNVVSLNTTSSQSELIDYVQLEFKKSADTSWLDGGYGELGLFQVNDLEDGTYDFRVRAVSGLGIKGDYTTRSGYKVEGLSQPPQDVTGFAAEVNGDTINLSWTAVTDLDLSYYIIRHASETTGATWAGSVTYVEKVARPSTESNVPAKAGTYLIKAVDKTGVQSINATTVVVSADVITARATVVTVTENPTFTGTKTDVVLQDGEIRLGTVANFDSLTGNIDSLTGQWDALGISYVNTSGTYYFANVIDRTVAEQGFITVDMVTRRFDTTNGLWDDLAGDIDVLAGYWDALTGVADFNDTNVIAYVSTTNDNPSGSPTWSAWTKIRAANIYGRGLRFKVELHSDAAGISPTISELSATGNYA